MHTIRNHVIRHLVSVVAGVPSLLIIWGVVNPEMNRLRTGEYPAEMFPLDAGLFNCLCASFFLFAVYAPLAEAAEMLLIRRLRWHPGLSILAVAGAILIVLGILLLLANLLLGPVESSAIPVVAVDFTLWGVAYWWVFLLMGRLLDGPRNA